MYAQNFPDACKNKPIQVYDRLAAPPNPKDDDIWSDVAKFYLIGLGGRGQKALAKYGVWKDVKDVCTSVVGRKGKLRSLYMLSLYIFYIAFDNRSREIFIVVVVQ